MFSAVLGGRGNSRSSSNSEVLADHLESFERLRESIGGFGLHAKGSLNGTTVLNHEDGPSAPSSVIQSVDGNHQSGRPCWQAESTNLKSPSNLISGGGESSDFSYSRGGSHECIESIVTNDYYDSYDDAADGGSKAYKILLSGHDVIYTGKICKDGAAEFQKVAYDIAKQIISKKQQQGKQQQQASTQGQGNNNKGAAGRGQQQQQGNNRGAAAAPAAPVKKLPMEIEQTPKKEELEEHLRKEEKMARVQQIILNERKHQINIL
jgi:hypothetical protein